LRIRYFSCRRDRLLVALRDRGIGKPSHASDSTPARGPSVRRGCRRERRRHHAVLDAADGIEGGHGLAEELRSLDVRRGLEDLLG
jgi:hypothetical protein